jgi:hypothetical protein
MNVFVAIASLVVVSYLTYFIAKNEQTRDYENKILENSKIRPILISELLTSFNKNRCFRA